MTGSKQAIWSFQLNKEDSLPMLTARRHYISKEGTGIPREIHIHRRLFRIRWESIYGSCVDGGAHRIPWETVRSQRD
jgi:hypothetical protein